MEAKCSVIYFPKQSKPTPQEEKTRTEMYGPRVDSQRLRVSREKAKAATFAAFTPAKTNP